MDLLFEKFPEPIYKNGALFCFSPNTCMKTSAITHYIMGF